MLTASQMNFLLMISISLLLAIVVSCIVQYSSKLSHYYTLTRHRILSISFRFSNYDGRPVSAAYKAFEYMYFTSQRLPSLSAKPQPDEIARMRRETTFEPFLSIHRRCRMKRCVYVYEDRSVDAYWVSTDATETRDFLKQPFVLYLHGGAYVLGDIQGYHSLESQLSERLRLPFCHIEYSRGPEKPLPNALEDVIAVYKAWLMAEPSIASRVILMGDSAGGGLCLLFIQSCVQLNLRTPVAVLVVSPWADLSTTGDGCELVEVSEGLQLVRSLRKQAFGGTQEPTEEQIKRFSPLLGSFIGFPPLYIATGQQLRLNDDSCRLAAKAIEQQVDVTFDKGIYMIHTFPYFCQYYPEGSQSMNNICRWIQKQLNSLQHASQ